MGDKCEYMETRLTVAERLLREVTMICGWQGMFTVYNWIMSYLAHRAKENGK